VFKQYREADGRFHFKLVDGDRLLLQGDGFASPRDAGQLVARLKAGEDLLHVAENGRVRLGDDEAGTLGDGVDGDALRSALARFADVAA
jgi:tryptophanyl-tRNA synthetase